MDNHYDESLQENPFLEAILRDYESIVESAINENWLICIPRLHSFKGSTVSEEDVKEHILVPLPNENGFETLSKRKVVIYDKRIIVGDDVNNVAVLFDETVYVSGNKKYKLLCIERPLTQIWVKEDVYCVRSVRDCVQLLWSVLDDVNELIETVFYDGFHSIRLDTLQAKYSTLFKRCNRLATKKSLSNTQKFGARNLTLAVETYIQHCICNTLVGAISSANSYVEGDFNRIVRNNSHVQLRDLGICHNNFENVLVAKRELHSINKFSTALGKIGCLRRTVEALSFRKQVTTADDLLKVFIFLILKSNINNWISNLIFINNFRLSALNLCEENSFLITTLEAAIEYIKSATFDFDSLHSENSSLDSLNGLFKLIRRGNLSAIADRFDNETVPIGASNCHPLCCCDKCESSTRFNLNGKDENGNNALHISAFYGQVHIMEYLIDKNVNLKLPNNFQALPIHRASSSGHQNALLFLLHSNSPIEPQDGDGNTPLHVASANGHENCVKALLYFAEQKGYEIDTNRRNNAGDTALHYAAKWSYVGIVKILLDYGAGIQLTNNLHQNVYDVAHNDSVKKMLTEHSSIRIKVLNPLFPISSVGTKPKNEKQTKKMDLIQKAIENNDLPLMCFHLGIPAPDVASNHSISFTMCHPLCVCDKCEQLDTPFETVSNTSISTETINLNTCNLDGYTPLHFASKCGFVEIVRLLLDSGALINAVTYDNRYTPLHLACMYRHIRVVRELLKCGTCDTNEIDVIGNTPLHYACLNNDSEIVDLILRRSGNCNIKNNNGKTALQLTKRKKSLIANLEAESG